MRDRRVRRRRDRHNVVRAQRRRIGAVLAGSRIVGRLAVVHHILVVRVGTAVIRPAIPYGLHVQRRRALRHLQRADRPAHRVVRARHVPPRDRVCVLALAHRSLAARHRHRDRLVACKGNDRRRAGRQGRGGLAERCRAVSRQGLAVVFLLVGLRHDRQGRRIHRQGALNVLALRVVVLVLHRPRERVVHRGLGHMCDRRRSRRRHRQHVARAQSELGLAFRALDRLVTVVNRVRVVRVRRRVVRPLAVGALHVQLRRALCHLQRAVDINNLVVSGHIGLSILHYCCTWDVVALADLRLAARHRYTFNIISSLQSNRWRILPTIIRQRCTVVFLFIAIRRNRQGCFRHFYRNNFYQGGTSRRLVAGGGYRKGIGASSKS